MREELESKNFNVVELRLCEMRDSDLRDELELADLILVGTSTINRDAPPQAWHALSLFLPGDAQGEGGRSVWFLWLEW